MYSLLGVPRANSFIVFVCSVLCIHNFFSSMSLNNKFYSFSEQVACIVMMELTPSFYLAQRPPNKHSDKKRGEIYHCKVTTLSVYPYHLENLIMSSYILCLCTIPSMYEGCACTASNAA